MTVTASFVFVTSNNACGPLDDITRGKIRRQAMSRVKHSRRKQDRNHHIAIVAKADPNLFQSRKAGGGPVCNIPLRPSSTGYEKVRMKYQFDVLDLSGFTTIYIPEAEALSLVGHPTQILRSFRSRHDSFLSYIPARFGFSRCCDDAVRCVAAACHSIIVKDDPRSLEVLALYTRALQSLQTALRHPIERFKPETLCAVDILAIYELLSVVNEEHVRWRGHVLGGASLIASRGPESYESDFERSLLQAQVGPLFTEAITDRRYCVFKGNAAKLQADIARQLDT